MEKLESRLRSAARGLALLGFLGLLGLALMTACDVVLRWSLSMPIQGVNDVSAVVMAVVISACIPANLAMKQNISVEVLGALGGGRLRRVLDAFSSLVTLLFILGVAWQFVPYAANLHANGERTWVVALPVWPFWSVAAVIMIFAALVQTVVCVGDLVGLAGRGARTRHDAGPSASAT